jgi:hypothetical protein
VPLYGMAACQRCLEEFDTLLECSTFSSPTWARASRMFDVSRVANMLLARGLDDDAALPWHGSAGATALLHTAALNRRNAPLCLGMQGIEI